MADLTITKSGEFMVAHIEGLTDPGVEFVDSWYEIDIVVVDAGRIIIPGASADAFENGAIEAGLTVEHEQAAV